LALSVRLGVLLPEVEKLEMPVLRQYLAFLTEPAATPQAAEPAADVELQLRKVFGRSNG
jgi:hypothetical protein